jgi:hypothetical protein
MLADEFAFPPQITRPGRANLARVEFPASSGPPVAGTPATRGEAIEALLDSRRADATGRAPTRTDRTTVRYQRTVRDLVRQARVWGDLETEERLEQALAWFSVQHERWSRARSDITRRPCSGQLNACRRRSGRTFVRSVDYSVISIAPRGRDHRKRRRRPVPANGKVSRSRNFEH